ncbi:MAG TPA: hypothetical protein VIL72_04770 [Beijerinckiaceae bacterium]|jgi:hypothetical protein
MAHFAEEAARSLQGAWRLLQRQDDGLSRFEVSESGFWRSFGAIALSFPAFITLLAAERAHEGLHPGALFTEAGPVFRATVVFLAIWATPLIATWLIAGLLDLRRRAAGFIIALNWSGLLAAAMLALPALLFATNLATEAHAFVFTVAALALIAHLQWFTAKLALGVSGGVAAALVCAEFGIGALLRGALA